MYSKFFVSAYISTNLFTTIKVKGLKMIYLKKKSITEKDLLEIKNKQVKLETSEALSINILLEKNWLT
jgi:hypothetical protein